MGINIPMVTKGVNESDEEDEHEDKKISAPIIDGKMVVTDFPEPWFAHNSDKLCCLSSLSPPVL